MTDNFRSTHRFIAYFAQFPDIKFTGKTGGEESNEVNQVFPGGSNVPVNVEGPTTTGQVTLSKPWDAVKDVPILAWNRRWSKGVKLPLTLIVQPVSAAGIPDGGPDTYVGCSRVSVTPPELSRGGGEEAMLEVVVQPTRKV